MDDNLHVEKRSGASTQRREQLKFAVMDCRSGDTLVVWRLDRLTRSMPDLYALLDTLKAKGVGIRSLTEHIDTATPAGRLAMNTMMAFAQFERDSTSQRTQAGIAAIRARRADGGRWGPKRIMTATKIKRVGKLLNGGSTGPKVAKLMGVSTASIYSFWRWDEVKDCWLPKSRDN
jgi:DNA invertase Pin-like site-specific DNA recombinase